LRLISVLSILLLAASAAKAAPHPAGRTVNARQLLEIVEITFEEAHRAAEAGGLDPRARRHRPFWKAMDRAGGALERVGRALRNRDQAFYDSLAQGSKALGELQVAWLRAGARAPEVDAKLRLLLRSYRLLRTSYGAEHLRSARGGELTPAESESFAYLQLLHGQLADRLDALQQRSAVQGDRATAAEMARLETESESIAEAEPSVDAYLTSRIASDELAGEWEGHRGAAPAKDAALWSSARQTVEQLATDPAVGHVFALDLGDLDDWSHLDAPTFLPDEPEVEVFTPVRGEEDSFASTGDEDEDIAGLFPSDSADPDPSPADPTAAWPAAAERIELPPMLATLLLWLSMGLG
jgi:hypothetical protein